MLEPGMILGERYEIIQKIGAGGMSIVYKAKCHKLQRFVAVKVLREEFVQDESFVKKFRAEALSAASLSHPNIVGIYDVGSENDLHYIVMEYVEGQTLKEVIAKEGPMTSQVVLEYGMQILSAVRHAHLKQIIHRDIKPQNILVTNEGVLKVTDFGIARAVDSSTLVATGNAIGSVHYFSPEQAKGKYVNETSDLYSCGIVLFELATKRLPFEADSHVSIALKHINEEIPKPTTFNQSILPALEQIILKATNKRQELRYQTAEEMMEDMKEVMADPNRIFKTEQEDMQTILLSEEETEQIRQGERLGNVLEEDEELEDEEISPLYKILVSIGGILITLLIVGIVSATLWLSPHKKEKFIAVPSVIGKTVEDAEAFLKSEGTEIVIEVIAEEESGEYEEGVIIKQTPGSDEKIKTEGTIQVTLAKAVGEGLPKEVDVPDVIDIDASEAQRMLDARGLFYRVERAYHTQIEQGKVIDQNPKANSKALEGDIITLIVSKGPEQTLTTVPNLISLNQDQAKTSLKNAGLNLGKVTEQTSETVAKGLIMSQNYTANEQIDKGSSINIVISSGKPEQPQPEVEPSQPVEQLNPGEQVVKTKSFTINLPEGNQNEEYHVMILFESNQGSSTVFDGRIRKEQFPYTVQLQGSGEGVLITHFDSVVVYSDRFSFND